MNHFLKHKLASLSLLFLFGMILLTPAGAFAATTTSSGGGAVGTQTCADNEVAIDGGKACCPKNAGSNVNSCLFAKYINPVVNLLSAAVGIVVVIAIIVGAIQFSTSAGDPQKAATGKKHIQNALIGLLAFFLLYAFLQFVIPGGLLNATTVK